MAVSPVQFCRASNKPTASSSPMQLPAMSTRKSAPLLRRAVLMELPSMPLPIKFELSCRVCSFEFAERHERSRLTPPSPTACGSIFMENCREGFICVQDLHRMPVNSSHGAKERFYHASRGPPPLPPLPPTPLHPQPSPTHPHLAAGDSISLAAALGLNLFAKLTGARKILTTVW